MDPDPPTPLCRAVPAVDAELRRLTEERDLARAALLACAERLAVCSALLTRAAERPDRRDSR